MTLEFWRGRRVFLTGHTGFKGSWLSLWLHRLGAEVAGYSLEPATKPSLFELAKIEELVRSQIGDVRDADALTNALVSFEPEIVIHMAAQPLVRKSYEDPLETYSVNVMGTVNLFEAIRKVSSVKAVLNVTTDKVYENVGGYWGYREKDPLGGYDPYSSSKACSELVTAAYRSSFFNAQSVASRPAVATARAGNVVGGGDWSADRLVPDLIAALSENRQASIRYPGAVRPWQHVLEPLRGYLELSQRLVESGSSYAQSWNFGPDERDARPVAWIADQLAREWGVSDSWRQEGGDHPHEAAFLRLDISKSRALLHWSPAMKLEKAIELIVRWFREFQHGGDARELTLSQIEQYQCSVLK